MDMWSASDVARWLNTSVPRVQRAVSRLGMASRRGAGGRLRLTVADVDRLRRELGYTPSIPGLSRTEVMVLAALADAPRGVASTRALAQRAGVSPTAAGRALTRLLDRGLALSERQTLPLGRAREVDVIHANVLATQWPRLLPLLAAVTPPARPARPPARRVPAELAHLFWNVAASQMSTREHGGFIARRLISSGDLDGIAWGAENLTRSDWQHAARTRGLPPDKQAFALNLAAAARQEAHMTPSAAYPPATSPGPARRARPSADRALIAMSAIVGQDHETVDDRLFAIAVEQDGLITAAQAEHAGVDRRALARRAKPGGPLRRVRRGLYRLRRFPEGRRPHVWEAWVPLAHVGALVSHAAALDLYELSDLVAHGIDITLPADQRWRAAPPGVRLHFTQNMPAARSIQGLKATDVEHTIIDTLAELDAYGQTQTTITDALARRLATPTRLRECWPARNRTQLERILAAAEGH